MRRGIATFPLDRGKCPPYLFQMMKRLARSIAIAIVEEFGSEELLKRLADVVWLQSFGSLLGWDWNSSGLGVVSLAALKEGLKGLEDDLGIYICGGKRNSKKTPQEIKFFSEKRGFKFGERLIYFSKLVAKVDNCLLQDGFSLYHHNFVFLKNGKWAVIQQGMNLDLIKARRYHWLGEKIKNFIQDPEEEIISDIKTRPLNLISKKSRKNKEVSLKLVKESPKRFLKDISLISQKSDKPMEQKKFSHFLLLDLKDVEFSTHPILKEKFDLKRLKKIIYKIHFFNPKDFENLLMIEGVGPKTIRALSLVSEIIYGAEPSYKDPVRYSFAHGGKDSVPYPLDKKTYKETIFLLEKGVKKAKISILEKEKLLKRLYEQNLS